jgi:hypothetical protein
VTYLTWPLVAARSIIIQACNITIDIDSIVKQQLKIEGGIIQDDSVSTHRRGNLKSQKHFVV